MSGVDLSFLCERFIRSNKESGYDILISATGKANFIKKEYIKSGITLIDISMNKNPETNKTCGDMDLENCFLKAKNIIPVPVGIGPIIITVLLKNFC